NDKSSNSWSSAANYPTTDSWEGCGGIDGKVYCAGGISGGTTFKSGNVYDPSSDSWSPIADMPTDLWGGVAGAPTGELVLSSGVINSSSTVPQPDRRHYERHAPEELGQAEGSGHWDRLQQRHEGPLGRRLRGRQHGLLVDGKDGQERELRLLGAEGHLHADRQRKRVDSPIEDGQDPARQDDHGQLQPAANRLLVD